MNNLLFDQCSLDPAHNAGNILAYRSNFLIQIPNCFHIMKTLGAGVLSSRILMRSTSRETALKEGELSEVMATTLTPGGEIGDLATKTAWRRSRRRFGSVILSICDLFLAPCR